MKACFRLWGAVQGGGNFVLHSAGWLEGGLRASFEKTILDIDLLQMVTEMLTPLDLSEDALAIDAIRDVGPGGHFFGTPHTQARYKRLLFADPVGLAQFRDLDRSGVADGLEKANRVWKERLATYEEPPMDPAMREELDAFVERASPKAAHRPISDSTF
jgi:trimethylamine--corrinoid protein Co-methyltransferase